MKSLNDPFLRRFEEIAKILGSSVSRSTKQFDDYIEIHGNGITMRVRWELEGSPGTLITFYKTPENGKNPHELNLSWFIEFKNGSSKEIESAASSNTDILLDMVKKYVLGYLTGNEKNFDEIEEYAKRMAAEHFKPDPNTKIVKWIRKEWIP